jgi:predicted RND superfamily exporter protein/outer membrane lipoprotein-sorting protein
MKHHHLISLAWLITTVAFGWSLFQLPNLKTEYSVDQFYPKDHPLLKDHDDLEHVFRLPAQSPYLFVIKEKARNTWLKKDMIKKLQEVTNLLSEKSNIAQVISLTNVEGASQQDDSLIIGNLFDREHENNWREKVLTNPLLYPVLVTEDFRSTMLVIEPKDKTKKDLEKLEKELKTTLGHHFPEATIYFAGVPLLQNKLSDMIQSELGIFLICTSVLFCAIFYLLFSHWSAILCALFTLTLSNMFALALMSACNIPMNAILVTLPVIVSVSIMSLLIHSLHLWSTRNSSNLNYLEKSLMAFGTLKEIALPNALGIFTTALGFLALSPSAIPLISQYGFTVAIILSGVALLSQILIFLALPFVRGHMRSWLERPAQWALWPLLHARKIVGFIIFLSIAGIVLLSHLNFSFRLFNDLPKEHPVRSTTEWIDDTFGGILNYDVNLEAKEESFWRQPQSLKRLADFNQTLRQTKGIGTVVSVPDFFQGQVPNTQGEISEIFFLFSMAQKNPLHSFMTEDGRSMRISIRLRDLPSFQIDESKASIREAFTKSFPELSYKEGGMASYAHQINQEVARALIFDFWQPLLLIGIALIFIFRSWKWALLSCLPNIVPPAILICALGVSNVPVKPGVALIFSIALGFAFNNTLYLLSRMKGLIEKKVSDPLKEALLMEGNPCLLESFIMLVGFSIFMFSEFDMNKTFGGFMLISIFAGFLADLIFLPSFLKLFPQSYQVALPRSKKVSMLTASLTLFISTSAFAANNEAKDILQKSQALLEAKDDTAKVEMKIIEKNGEVKSRNLNLQTLRSEGFKVLARIESPADIKDMGFLGHVDEEGNEMQWIYMPSSGQVRRLVTGKTKAGLLGSEIGPEDLNSEAIKSSSVKFVKSDEKYHWIELKPTPGSSEYTRVVMKIAKADLLPSPTFNFPSFTAYYVEDKLKKTVAFKDYKKVGPIWRAQQLNVQNHLNGRSTEVRLSQIEVNKGLKGDDFTQSSLKEN